MNRKSLWFLICCSFFTSLVFAAGETSNGTLVVNGTIDGTILLTLETATNAGGNNLTLGGVTSATKNLGTINRFMTAPADWAVATTASDWSLQSYVGVKVTKANVSSSNHTLAARLSASPASGISWTFGGVALNTISANVTATGLFDTKADYLMSVTISNTAADGSTIDNTLNLTATAN